VYDPIQKARICLVDVGWGRDIMLELIEPADAHSTVANFLQKTGGGLHHLCFEVASKDEVQALAKRMRMLPILGPVPAAAFAGRQVMFYFTKGREVIEFLGDLPTTSGQHALPEEQG
jgi:hypothetical protein